MISCWREAMLIDRLCKKSTSKKKKIQTKAWYRILSAEILTHENFDYKTMQISEDNELFPTKWI